MSRLRKVQIAAIVFFGVVAGAALIAYPEAKIRAPLLTMTGGAIILVPLVPTGRFELPQVATLLGTMVALLGGWFWLSDATDGKPGTTLATVMLGAVGLVLLLTMLAGFFRILGAASTQEDPDMFRRRRIVRRTKKQLQELVQETRSMRPVFSNGLRYAQHDFDISTLFINTWSMLANQHRTTYAWKEHENLVENYLVERLEIIAKIAVTKHPHQCKFGEIGQSMADEFKILLPRVNVVKEFDPSPACCPECREPKPTHKVNCMAAICWRCKFPTPPIKSGGECTTVITPQCRIPEICYERGEQVAASAPVLERIRLPFTLPHNGSDDCLSMIQWPRDRGQLKDLLEQLQREEDAVS